VATRTLTRRRRTRGAWAVALCAALALTACGGGGGGDDTAAEGTGDSGDKMMTREEIANLTGPDRTERLLAQAEKEGALMLYTTMDTPEAEEFLRKFKEKYPQLKINTQTYRAGVGDLTQRLSSEFKAGVHSPDVVSYSSNWLEFLGKNEGIFAPFTTPVSEEMDLSASENLEYSIPIKAQPYLVAYNKKKVDASQLPKTWDDLITNDYWKGKVAIESTDADWMGALFEELGEEEATRIMEGLKNLGVKAVKGHTSLTELTGAGQYPLSLTNYIGTINDMKAKNPDLEWLALDTTVVGFNGVAYPTKPPNPAAGMLFVDFMMQEEGQRLLADAGDVILRKDMSDASTLADILGDAKAAPISVDTLEVLEEKYQPIWEKYILR
jgi:iron(III) transport system substrate-binding protein